MLELFINKQENLKRIALVENGKLIELYEQTEDEIRN